MNSMTEAGAAESLDAKPLKLGEILLAAQKISRNDLDRALEVQRSMGGRLGRLLVNLGIVSEADVFIALAHQFDLPLVRPESFPYAGSLRTAKFTSPSSA